MVVHQHTRLLENGISDLRERADGTRAEDVRTRLQQLLEELDAKYNAIVATQWKFGVWSKGVQAGRREWSGGECLRRR